MALSKQEIIDWVQNYEEPLHGDANKARFTATLNEQISQMDFRAVKI